MPGRRIDHTTDVLVIGAGLHGASVAMQLAGHGQKVIVVDRGIGGRHSSSANAGGVRRLWRDLRELSLAFEAAHMWRDLKTLVGDDCGYVETGGLKVAESADDMAALETRIERAHKAGFRHERLIDRAELRSLVPNLSDHCVGAIHVPDDGFASPYRTTRAFQDQARRNGADILFHHPVREIAHTASSWVVQAGDLVIEAGIIINCAGAWGDIIATEIGDDLPLSAEAPTMMVTAPMPQFLTPVVGAVSRKLSFKQAPNGIVLIGGGHRGFVDRITGKTRPDFLSLARSARTVIDLFPEMAQVPIVRAWCGIEGLTPDHLPYIGQSPTHDTVYHVFGFSSHGFQLAPIVGQQVAELILDGRSRLSLDAFSPNRFSHQSLETLGARSHA